MTKIIAREKKLMNSIVRNPDTKLELWENTLSRALETNENKKDVLPSDVDGLVERRSHFLFLDTKKPRENFLGGGQKIAYERLANFERIIYHATYPRVLYVILQTTENYSDGNNYFQGYNLIHGKGFPTTVEEFRALCGKWWKYATSNETEKAWRVFAENQL